MPAAVGAEEGPADLSHETVTIKSETSAVATSPPVKVIKTQWKLIAFAGLAGFACAVENTAVGMNEWLYMKEIDHKATIEFFGLAGALSKTAHAIFSLVFSIWSYKSRTIRHPLLVGRVIAMIGCILYLCVEYFPHNKRYLMLSCYILFGIASSASTVLRAYLAMISAPADRSRAFAVLTAGVIMSLIIGPLVQTVFTWLQYPGVRIFSKIRLHVYSAPIWFGTISNIVAFPLIICGIQELDSDNVFYERTNAFTWAGIKKSLTNLRRTQLDWPLIVVCWFLKFVATYSYAIFVSLMSILLTVQYGYQGNHAVYVQAIVTSGVGAVTLFVLGLYVFAKLGRWISQRYTLLATMVIFAAAFFISAPYPSDSNHVAQWHNKTRTGCNPKEYSWCESGRAIHLSLLIVALLLIKGFGVPNAYVSLDTIYSKVLAGVDQNILQGAIIVAEDAANIATPLYVTAMFTDHGILPLWLSSGGIFVVAGLVWAMFLRRARKYSS